MPLIRLKSGVVTMDRLNVWLAVRLPLVPVMVITALEMAKAVEDAVNCRVFELPGYTTGVAGDTVTPLGSPVTESAMTLLKPLTAVADTLMVCEVPRSRESEDWLNPRVKEGGPRTVR